MAEKIESKYLCPIASLGCIVIFSFCIFQSSIWTVQMNFFSDFKTSEPPDEQDSSVSDSEIFRLHNISKSSLRIYVYDVSSTVLGLNETKYGTRCRETPRGVGWDTHFEMEFLIPEYVKRSGIFTTNMDEADLFLVQHDLLCRYFTAGRDYHSTDIFDGYMLPLLRHIIAQPAWRRSHGADHLFIYTMDNGIFCDEKAVHHMDLLHPYVENMTLIGNFGVAHNAHCFRTGRDIVIPQPHAFPYDQHLAPHGRPNSTRKHAAYFRGQIVPGHFCSPGVRPRLEAVARSWFHADADLLYQDGDVRQADCPRRRTPMLATVTE